MTIKKWLRHNLFPTWYHTLISSIILIAVLIILPPILKWTIFDATFFGNGPQACTKGGACWVFIHMRFEQFMYGFYPRDLVWRINLSYLLFAINFATIFYVPKEYKHWLIASLFTLLPIASIILYYGGIFGLEVVDTYSWSGLSLTILLAIGSMLLSIPLGLLLALCRASKLPVIHGSSVMFIELWRGVPLVSVLFMASILIPLFFPEDIHFDRILRALIGISIFYSAYMAEVIHDGLNKISRGQYEAANSLAFNYSQSIFLIILPQVFKQIIPGIVHVFTRLLKDTTLVLLIGLYDFLGMVQAAAEDPKWLNYGMEGYIFAIFVYWLFCYLMKRISKHLDHKLQMGHR